MSRSELVFPASVVEELKEHLIREDGMERFAVGYCGKSRDRFLAADIHPVSDEDLAQQGRGKCRPNHDLETEHVNRCVDLGKHPLFIHSHPFDQNTTAFSGDDYRIMKRAGKWLKPHFPDTEVLFAVFAQNSVIAGQYDHAYEEINEIPVDVVGHWRLDDQLRFQGGFKPNPSLEPDKEVYDRNIRAITEEGQRKISSTTVGVVGCGGLGSIIAEQLVRLGVENLEILDPDEVEKSNLPRLQGATSDDVGRRKAAVLSEHLSSISAHGRISPGLGKAQDSPGKLSSCDVLIAGLDNMDSRMWLNDFSVKHLIPWIDSGVRIEKEEEKVTGMKGIVQVIAPGVTSCFSCINRGNQRQAQMETMQDEDLEADVEEGYIDGSELAPEPAVVHLNGLIASKAVDQFVRMVTGITEPDSLVEYDGFQTEFSTFDIGSAPQCAVCGSEMLGRGGSLPGFTEIESVNLGEELGLEDAS
jgi:molybdopterin/thiamine biosynthesis adenylyltransferase